MINRAEPKMSALNKAFKHTTNHVAHHRTFPPFLNFNKLLSNVTQLDYQLKLHILLYQTYFHLYNLNPPLQ